MASHSGKGQRRSGRRGRGAPARGASPWMWVSGALVLAAAAAAALLTWPGGPPGSEPAPVAAHGDFAEEDRARLQEILRDSGSGEGPR